MRSRLIVMLVAATGCQQLFGFEGVVLDEDGRPSESVTRRLVFDNAASVEDLVDFPVLVVLDDTRIDYAIVPDPARGFAFRVPGVDVALPYEVETWDPTGRSYLWVAVPSIRAASSADSILMTYGGFQDPAAPEDVWSGIALVQHMTPGFANAAGPTLAGSSNNVTLGVGQVGTAAVFGGTANEEIKFANSAGSMGIIDNWSELTLELWLRPSYSSGGISGEPFVIDKMGPLRMGRIFQIGADVRFQIDMETAGGSIFPNVPVRLNEWNYFVFVYGGMSIDAYADAIVMSSTSASGTFATGGELQLGGTNPIAGAIDELRVTELARSSSWIRAQYLSMSDLFVTFEDP